MKKLPAQLSGEQRPGLAVLHMNPRARGELLSYFASHFVEEPALPNAEIHPGRTCELLRILPFDLDHPAAEAHAVRRIFQKKVVVLGNMSFTGWEEIEP